LVLAVDRLALCAQVLAEIANDLEQAGGLSLFGEVARLREVAKGAREVLNELDPEVRP
jgi:hypothetical protein